MTNSDRATTASNYAADILKTAERLAGQLTENTGTHILDSGGAYGRGWQLRAGMTGRDILDAPNTVIDEYGCIEINSGALLVEHLSVTRMSETLTAQFRDYVDSTPKDMAYYNSLGSVEDWLDSVGVEDYRADNTYNYETFLDNVFQFAEFSYGDRVYVALSTHNGADVRGGYSDYVIYAGCTDWLYSALQALVFCRMCSTPFTVDIHDGVTDGDGVPYDGLGDRGACPKCHWRELIGDRVAGCVE